MKVPPMTPELPPERIAELREFFGPRTYGCECTLSWDEMTALLDATEQLRDSRRMLEEERGLVERLDIRRREGRQLLHRLIKYVREDRAVTPGSTRLARLVEDVDDYLNRTSEPSDILRSAAPATEPDHDE